MCKCDCEAKIERMQKEFNREIRLLEEKIGNLALQFIQQQTGVPIPRPQARNTASFDAMLERKRRERQ